MIEHPCPIIICGLRQKADNRYFCHGWQTSFRLTFYRRKE